MQLRRAEELLGPSDIEDAAEGVVIASIFDSRRKASCRFKQGKPGSLLLDGRALEQNHRGKAIHFCVAHSSDNAQFARTVIEGTDLLKWNFPFHNYNRFLAQLRTQSQYRLRGKFSRVDAEIEFDAHRPPAHGVRLSHSTPLSRCGGFLIGTTLDSSCFKTAARQFDMVLEASKMVAPNSTGLCRVETQHRTGAAFCAGVLGQHDKAGLGSFGGGAVAKPGCQRHTRGKFGSNASHIENNRAEAACLQDQVGDSQGLVEPRPWLCWQPMSPLF